MYDLLKSIMLSKAPNHIVAHTLDGSSYQGEIASLSKKHLGLLYSTETAHIALRFIVCIQMKNDKSETD